MDKCDVYFSSRPGRRCARTALSLPSMLGIFSMKISNVKEKNAFILNVTNVPLTVNKQNGKRNPLFSLCFP